jgi:hypothetical protein
MGGIASLPNLLATKMGLPNMDMLISKYLTDIKIKIVVTHWFVKYVNF